jgi:hypothetical protein
MTRPQILTEEHHRRSKSIGGTDDPANISYVPPRLHKHWHTLFGNMNAFQIRDELNEWCAPPRKKVICKYIGGPKVTQKGGHQTKKKSKREKAFKMLFKDMEFSQIIDYINSIWLDRSYHFYILSR